MIYSPMINKAMKIAYKAHHGKTDRAGVPYIFHPIHIAEQMIDEDSIIVALLHDVVEDTDITIDKLKSEGFNDRIIDALCYLTHDKEMDYMTYINLITRNDIARKVKLADLMHNSELTRLKKVTDRDIERVRKYSAAIKLLRNSCNTDR